MAELAFAFKDVFVALIIVGSLVIWARDKQRRMDRKDDIDGDLARTLSGRDA